MGSLAGRQEIIARFVGHTFRREGRSLNGVLKQKEIKKFISQESLCHLQPAF
jgi:hypothetical protein